MLERKKIEAKKLWAGAEGDINTVEIELNLKQIRTV